MHYAHHNNIIIFSCIRLQSPLTFFFEDPEATPTWSRWKDGGQQLVADTRVGQATLLVGRAPWEAPGGGSQRMSVCALPDQSPGSCSSKTLSTQPFLSTAAPVGWVRCETVVRSGRARCTHEVGDHGSADGWISECRSLTCALWHNGTPCTYGYLWGGLQVDQSALHLITISKSFWKDHHHGKCLQHVFDRHAGKCNFS